MFIKDEYDNSLRAALHRQRQAVFESHQLMGAIRDEELFQELKQICFEQAQMYCDYKDLVDSFDTLPQDKRLEKRVNSLGSVKLQEDILGAVGEGHCLDISESGIRLDVETSEEIHQGRRFNLWIELFNGKPLMQKTALVRWCKKIEEAKYSCGLQFC